MPSRKAAVPVAVTGMGVLSACGRGTSALAAAVGAGRPAFAPVTRFDVSGRRTAHAAHLPGSPRLAPELVGAIAEACEQAGLDRSAAADSVLLLALHSDPATEPIAAEVADGVARRCGLPGPERVYTGACVAASSAVADAAALIASGAVDRVVVAAGYLVEPDTFAVFDAGRALARDGRSRPFSRDRTGLLLGDGVAAVVLESAAAAGRRGGAELARLAGWGRAGDAHHVCRPIPDGSGLARAIGSALGRAGIDPAQVGYVNANATGSALGDSAEAAALRTAFGPAVDRIPVSSTKAVHGHALEASALLEFAVTVLTLRTETLPVNAGYLGPAEDCRLDLVLGPRAAGTGPRRALTLNSAFGGANTALLLEGAAL
ncbi:MAG TPA: beta-ketoacyl synthase N-terminal-like domain-containing protein [Actinocrinis sp.]|nr:beta-ketoacyl synthase N-terminal-like domain-containing protein [Actinocrinis sp.]